MTVHQNRPARTGLPTLPELHRWLRTGEIRARDVLDAATNAYAGHGKALNAYKDWRGESQAALADHVDGLLAYGGDPGALAGVPASVKDLFVVSGYETHAGTADVTFDSMLEEGPIIGVLRRQAALLTGKTHTVEMAFGGLGVNHAWGTPLNPRSPDGHRVPGGSSSGAGVSVAAGTALLALGTDTAGSVRIPASVTGMVGLKVTAGRWPLEGIVPLSTTLDTPGLICRSVVDAAFAFEALEHGLHGGEGFAPRLRPASLLGVKIGVPATYFWEGNDPGINEAVQAAITRLERAGAKVSQVDVPGAAECFDLFQCGGVAASELMAFLEQQRIDIDRLSVTVRDRVEVAKSLSASDYLGRLGFLRRMTLRAKALFDEVDCIITPTVACSPPLLEDLANADAYRQANMRILKNTMIGNFLGMCGLTLPVGSDAVGMPVGAQLLCRGGEERLLLTIGLGVEKKLQE